MTRWRMRTVGFIDPTNVYASFDLFPDMSMWLETIGAKEYPTVGVIVFKRAEDITLFRLRFGV